MLDDKNIPWYKSDMCRPENIPRMKREIERHMFPDDGKKHPYWLSFDIDSVCATELHIDFGERLDVAPGRPSGGRG